MTEPIVVTDEMRQAVFRDMCNTQGHLLSLDKAIATGPNVTGPTIASQNGLLPHVYCGRCDKTWILVEESGQGYDDAEMLLRDRLYKTDAINRRPERPRRTPRKK